MRLSVHLLSRAAQVQIRYLPFWVIQQSSSSSTMETSRSTQPRLLQLRSPSLPLSSGGLTPNKKFRQRQSVVEISLLDARFWEVTMEWIENRSTMTRWILVPILFISSASLIKGSVIIVSWFLSIFWGEDAEFNLWFYEIFFLTATFPMHSTM